MFSLSINIVKYSDWISAPNEESWGGEDGCWERADRCIVHTDLVY